MVKGRSISVNLQKGRGLVLGLMLALGAAGCGTFSQYPLGMDQTTLGSLRTGQKTGDQKTFHKRTNGTARVLFAMAYGGNGITYSAIGAGLLRSLIERRKHPLASLFGFSRVE